MPAFVEFKNVNKRYKMGEVTISASDGVSFEINRGEFVVISGESGAGKTTLLNLLGGMDSCDGGEIIVDGRDISKLSPKQLISYRRYDVGFVFQFYNLISNLTARENVELASQICGDTLNPAEVLKECGLEDRTNSFPSQLSGGEQQRVSIARAIAKKPKLLLCDEPTGALDYQTGKMILKLLQDTCRNNSVTVIVITHNSAIAPIADRVIKIKNSQVHSVKINEAPIDVSLIEW
ncbi:MAG: ABC transporter ATP-binding protein [Oscillospiraceae bacterium]|jgi:putative ABC transport system ATP-binding protein